MKYYIKQAFAIFLYVALGSMTAFIIVMVPDTMPWLQYLLLAVNLLISLFVASLIYYKEGEEAMQVRNSNDIERQVIIRTGEDRPLKKSQEYGFIKGFMFGVIACAPLILLLFLHTLVIIFGGSATFFGSIANAIYFSVFAFFRVGTEGNFTMFTYYWSLVAIPVMSLTTGIANYIGGRKTSKLHDKIDEHKKEIYG